MLYVYFSHIMLTTVDTQLLNGRIGCCPSLSTATGHHLLKCLLLPQTQTCAKASTSSLNCSLSILLFLILP